MSRVIKKSPKISYDEKKESLIQDLVGVFNKLGFEVRIEKGTFKGGFCLLREQKIFLLNKNLEQDKKVNLLIKNIANIGVEGIYLKPSIRELVDKDSESEKLH